jgi:hypothetical protein
LTARATRPAHPYSFFAPDGALFCATLTLPCHITAATLLPLHPYLSPFTSNQHTHFPSPPSFLFHFTSFGNSTYCLHSRHSPPSPGTLTKHTPPELQLPRIFGFGTRPFLPRSASCLSTIVFAWLAQTNMPACRHLFKTNLTASDKFGLGFFFLSWKGNSPA